MKIWWLTIIVVLEFSLIIGGTVGVPINIIKIDHESKIKQMDTSAIDDFSQDVELIPEMLENKSKTKIIDLNDVMEDESEDQNEIINSKVNMNEFTVSINKNGFTPAVETTEVKYSTAPVEPVTGFSANPDNLLVIRNITLEPERSPKNSFSNLIEDLAINGIDPTLLIGNASGKNIFRSIGKLDFTMEEPIRMATSPLGDNQYSTTPSTVVKRESTISNKMFSEMNSAITTRSPDSKKVNPSLVLYQVPSLSSNSQEPTQMKENETIEIMLEDQHILAESSKVLPSELHMTDKPAQTSALTLEPERTTTSESTITLMPTEPGPTKPINPSLVLHQTPNNTIKEPFNGVAMRDGEITTTMPSGSTKGVIPSLVSQQVPHESMTQPPEKSTTQIILEEMQVPSQNVREKSAELHVTEPPAQSPSSTVEQVLPESNEETPKKPANPSLIQQQIPNVTSSQLPSMASESATKIVPPLVSQQIHDDGQTASKEKEPIEMITEPMPIDTPKIKVEPSEINATDMPLNSSKDSMSQKQNNSMDTMMEADMVNDMPSKPANPTLVVLPTPNDNKSSVAERQNSKVESTIGAAEQSTPMTTTTMVSTSTLPQVKGEVAITQEAKMETIASASASITTTAVSMKEVSSPSNEHMGNETQVMMTKNIPTEKPATGISSTEEPLKMNKDNGVSDAGTTISTQTTQPPATIKTTPKVDTSTLFNEIVDKSFSNPMPSLPSILNKNSPPNIAKNEILPMITTTPSTIDTQSTTNDVTVKSFLSATMLPSSLQNKERMSNEIETITTTESTQMHMESLSEKTENSAMQLATTTLQFVIILCVTILLTY